MKNTTKKKITLFATLAVLVLFLAGFECTVDSCSISFDDYTGSAVNVKAVGTSTSPWKVDSGTETLVGATISLYAYDSTTGEYSGTAYDTATVGSTGTYTFLAPSPGRYKVNGVQTGWTFVPRYIEVSSSGSTPQDLYAYLTADAGEYTIIASWENADIDVDLTLTYGQNGAATTTPWNTGDTTAATDRLRIYYGAGAYAGRGSTAGVMLNRDVTAESTAATPRVETISIYTDDWFLDNDRIKIYLDSPLTNQYLTGLEAETSYPAAFAQVDLMNGSTHFGTWYIPWNTFETTLQIIEMDYDATAGSLTVYSANNSVLLNGTTGNVSGIKSIIWE